MIIPNRWHQSCLTFVVAIAAALGCWGSIASQALAEDTGFEAGLRVGYGIPLGSAVKNGDLSDGVGGQVPLILDLGYRVIPNLFVGLYAQYGFAWQGGNASDGCDVSGISCSAHDIRLGIQAHFHFQPREKLDPWIGLGFGYEWLGLSVEGANTELSSVLSGFEFLNLQAGLDVRAADNFYIGPFLSLSFGQYSDLSLDCAAGFCGDAEFGANGGIEEKALHEWLLIGVRGAYAP